MIKEIILIGICVIMGILAICAFLMAHSEKKERYRTEKELEEVIGNENKMAEAVTEANRTKSNARTGNHSADIKYMSDKLHDYANK